MSPNECRERRLRLGASTYRLAVTAGLAERTVVRFEAGLCQPRPVTLVALRRALRGLEGAQGEAIGGR